MSLEEPNPQDETWKKVGLFGGSFDPVTLAHLYVIHQVHDLLDLDEVWLIPTSQNPIKLERTPAPPEWRLTMLEVAVSDLPYVQVSRLELDRKGPSYTVNTVRELLQRHPRHNFILIMGTDTYSSLPKWKEAEQLVKLIRFAVVDRPGDLFKALPGHESVIHLQIDPTDLSSTKVRDAIENGEPFAHLVPAGVADLIMRENLYHP